MTLPRYRPQLATLVEEPPRGPGWLHELKYDGYRIGCRIDAGRVRLESRRELDWTAQFPEVEAAARELRVTSALIDGEVAVVLPSGLTSFQDLQNAFSRAPRRGVTYFAFDLLYLDGRDLRRVPLEQRKRELEQVLERSGGGGVIRYSGHFDADGPEVFRSACELGAEGIVSKRRDAPYATGRNAAWLKTKCTRRQEFVVGGFTEPEGSRTGIGALLLGYYEGGKLRFAGKVGTGKGFTATYLAEVRRVLDSIAQPECSFDPPPPAIIARAARWVRPVLVGEVSFVEWTSDGHVRHPSFQGFRPDKDATEVMRER